MVRLAIQGNASTAIIADAVICMGGEKRYYGLGKTRGDPVREMNRNATEAYAKYEKETA